MRILWKASDCVFELFGWRTVTRPVAKNRLPYFVPKTPGYTLFCQLAYMIRTSSSARECFYTYSVVVTRFLEVHVTHVYNDQIDSVFFADPEIRIFEKKRDQEFHFFFANRNSSRNMQL